MSTGTRVRHVSDPRYGWGIIENIDGNRALVRFYPFAPRWFEIAELEAV